MNLSIYDYELPSEDVFLETEFQTIIPFKIKKPLSIHDNVLSLLVDLDENNEPGPTGLLKSNEYQILNIVRTRSFHDFHDFCERPAFIASYYQYAGCYNGLHYFIYVSKNE